MIVKAMSVRPIIIYHPKFILTLQIFFFLKIFSLIVLVVEILSFDGLFYSHYIQRIASCDPLYT